MSESDKTNTDPAAALEASGDYRVLRKLSRKTEFSADDGTPTKVGIILDIETTGLNVTSDEIIELGMIKFPFSADGRVFKVLDTFSELREPGVAIPAEVAELTGITPVMVAGHRIDADRVARFVEDAVLIIAHGGSFDRPFSEKLFPFLRRSTGPARTPRSTGRLAATVGANLLTCSTTSACSTRATARWTIATLCWPCCRAFCRPRHYHPSGRSSKTPVKPACEFMMSEQSGHQCRLGAVAPSDHNAVAPRGSAYGLLRALSRHPRPS
jgi:Exonuclease